MDVQNDCLWDFYVINSHNKIVMGFNDEAYAKRYAKVNRYRLYTRGTLKKKNINFYNLNNWTDKYSNEGIED